MDVIKELQLIEKKIDNQNVFVRPYMYISDGEIDFDDQVEWLIRTVKQQQSRIEELESELKNSEHVIEYGVDREIELQKKIRGIEESFKRMQRSGISPTDKEIEELKHARFEQQLRGMKG